MIKKLNTTKIIYCCDELKEYILNKLICHRIDDAIVANFTTAVYGFFPNK